MGMKKLLAGCLAVFSVSLLAATGVNPPAAALSHMKTQHPAATHIKWDMEENNYEAGFMENGKEVSVLYNGKGEMLETEVGIKASELPADALKYLLKNNKNKVAEAS